MRPAAFLEVYVDQLEGLDLSALCAANRVSGASLCVRLTVTAGHRCLGVAQTKPVNPGGSSCVVFNELLQIAIFEQHVDIRVGVVSAEESIALHRTDSQTNDLTGAFLAAAQLPTSAMASALIDGSRCDADTPATSSVQATRREAMTGRSIDDQASRRRTGVHDYCQQHEPQQHQQPHQSEQSGNQPRHGFSLLLTTSSSHPLAILRVTAALRPLGLSWPFPCNLLANSPHRGFSTAAVRTTVDGTFGERESTICEAGKTAPAESAQLSAYLSAQPSVHPCLSAESARLTFRKRKCKSGPMLFHVCTTATAAPAAAACVAPADSAESDRVMLRLTKSGPLPSGAVYGASYGAVNGDHVTGWPSCRKQSNETFDGGVNGQVHESAGPSTSTSISPSLLASPLALWTAPDTAPVAAWALFEQQNWQRARHPAALSLDSSRGAAGGAGAGGACLGGVFDKGARMGCFAGLADPLWQRGLSQASGDDDDDDEVSSTFRGDGSLSHVPELASPAGAGGVVSMGGGRAQACVSPTRSSQIPRKSVGREAENADMAVDLLLNELLDAQMLAERAEDCGGATGGGSVDGAEEGQGEFCGGAEEGEGESCGGFCCRGEARKGRCALSVSRLSLPCDFDTEGDCVGDCDGDCDDDCDGDCDDDCDGDCDGACDDGGDDYDGEKPHDWAEDVTEMQEEVIREYCQHHHQRQQKQREQETHKLEVRASQQQHVWYPWSGPLPSSPCFLSLGAPTDPSGHLQSSHSAPLTPLGQPVLPASPATEAATQGPAAAAAAGARDAAHPADYSPASRCAAQASVPAVCFASLGEERVREAPHVFPGHVVVASCACGGHAVELN
ncbi:unnamed protein product [Closterium sp. NIES-65]|nr:unnamed protein product [Closterium sp. NIES-65]